MIQVVGNCTFLLLSSHAGYLLVNGLASLRGCALERDAYEGSDLEEHEFIRDNLEGGVDSCESQSLHCI